MPSVEIAKRVAAPPTASSASGGTSSFRWASVCAEFLSVLSPLRHFVRIGLPWLPAASCAWFHFGEAELTRQALLVTFDEQVDPNWCAPR
jgi:hypothetical protein